jgi:hypothetical protein
MHAFLPWLAYRPATASPLFLKQAFDLLLNPIVHVNQGVTAALGAAPVRLAIADDETTRTPASAVPPSRRGDMAFACRVFHQDHGAGSWDHGWVSPLTPCL